MFRVLYVQVGPSLGMAKTTVVLVELNSRCWARATRDLSSRPFSQKKH